MTSKTPHADPVVTPELVKQHGLTPEEFEQIKKILGREPNFTELGVFSVMWSEHCSLQKFEERTEEVSHDRREYSGQSRRRKCGSGRHWRRLGSRVQNREP